MAKEGEKEMAASARHFTVIHTRSVTNDFHSIFAL